MQKAEVKQELILRDILAIERTELAFERTHLAWIRTMLTIMTAGIAIDKGIEFIHQQRLLTNQAIVQNGHVIGIVITSSGILFLLLETIQFIKRKRQLAIIKNATTSFFATSVILAVLVMLTGFVLIYLMITTG